MRIEDATISDLLAEVRKRTGMGFGGRSAKKIRKEVKKLQVELAQDLKAWIQHLGFLARLMLALKIVARRKW